MNALVVFGPPSKVFPFDVDSKGVSNRKSRPGVSQVVWGPSDLISDEEYPPVTRLTI